MIDPREAVTIARQMRHDAHSPAEVWGNDEVLVVGFADGTGPNFDAVLVRVDARTGAARTIGAGEFAALGALQPVYQTSL
jgi:hypothetical protein